MEILGQYLIPNEYQKTRSSHLLHSSYHRFPNIHQQLEMIRKFAISLHGWEQQLNLHDTFFPLWYLLLSYVLGAETPVHKVYQGRESMEMRSQVMDKKREDEGGKRNGIYKNSRSS